MIDLQDRLADYIEMMRTGLPLFNDSNDEGGSLALYSLPGGRTKREFMDGTQEKQFNFELQAKATLENRDQAVDAVGLISRKLEDITELASINGSYDFERIEIANEPYLSAVTKDRYIYFRLTLQALITIPGGKKE